MAAPQIPNLLTGGRGGRRGGRGFGRGTGSCAEGSSSEASAKQADLIVQATDGDANISRISAVQAGYLMDSFAMDFAPLPIPPGGFRRMPIINRGTYTRTTGIDRLVLSFLSSESGTQKQIMSLGAGSDTRFFRFRDSGYLENCIYHELDFPENTRKKVAVIQRSSRLQALVGHDAERQTSEDEIHSPRYHLHAVDLRTLDANYVSQQRNRPTLQAICAESPTLILSECCLTYLEPEAADGVIRYLMLEVLHEAAPKALVLYEPINPFDPFGKVMVSNLAARGIVLQTLHKYGSLGAQRQRLKTYGFEHGQRAIDLSFLHNRWIEASEQERLAHVEMLDEMEELTLLLQHYCLAWGWHDGRDPSIWKGWQNLEAGPS